MNKNEIIKLLESEWELETGFLGNLRHGQFNQELCRRCSHVLDLIEANVADAVMLDRRLVSLIWYIPIYMTWHVTTVGNSIDAKDYERVINEFQTKIQNILGVP